MILNKNGNFLWGQLIGWGKSETWIEVVREWWAIAEKKSKSTKKIQKINDLERVARYLSVRRCYDLSSMHFNLFTTTEISQSSLQNTDGIAFMPWEKHCQFTTSEHGITFMPSKIIPLIYGKQFFGIAVMPKCPSVINAPFHGVVQ